MSKPLDGKTILVTRARPQAGVFSAALREIGASVVEIPTIEIVPRKSDQLDEAIQSLGRYDWVFFTSVNGAAVFLERIGELVPKGSALGTSIGAIGPATSEEVLRSGYTVSFQPSRFQAEGIIDEFSAIYKGNLTGLRILIPRAKIARKILPETLTLLGAEVEVIPVYETLVPADSAALLNQVLTEARLDLITFTSSSTVRNLVALAGEVKLLARFECAAIGPITAETAEQLGLRVVVQPDGSTIPEFVTAIQQYLTSAAEI